MFKELLYLNELYTAHILGLDIEISGKKFDSDSKIQIILQASDPDFPKVKIFGSEASCKQWIDSTLHQVYLKRKEESQIHISPEQQLKSECSSIQEEVEMLWKVYIGDKDPKIIEFPNPPSSALVWSSVRTLKKEFPDDTIIVERINTQRTIIKGKE